MRTITIAPALNGWLVTVGCQTLAYNDSRNLMTDLGDYLKDPDATTKRFLETNAVNKKWTMAAGCVAPVPAVSLARLEPLR